MVPQANEGNRGIVVKKIHDEYRLFVRQCFFMHEVVLCVVDWDTRPHTKIFFFFLINLKSNLQWRQMFWGFFFSQELFFFFFFFFNPGINHSQLCTELGSCWVWIKVMSK